MRNLFCEKSYVECSGWAIPRPFLKKNQNWAYLWINSLVSHSFFLLYARVEDYWNILKLDCRLLLAFTSCKALLKNQKKVCDWSFYLILCMIFKENISPLTFYSLTKNHYLVVFTSWYIAQYGYCICLLGRLWRHKFLN